MRHLLRLVPSRADHSLCSYSLKADVLTPLGKQESYEAGVEAYKRYSGLLGGDAEPFVRSDSSARVVDCT